jgi:hypothetical protein
VFTGHATRRIRRRGLAGASALAALVAADCAVPAVQPRATAESLRKVVAAVRQDVFRQPVALGPVLAERAVLYFFRTGCVYCAADVAAAPGLAATRGFPPLILVSRESPSRLRSSLGPGPRPGLVVVSDSDGSIMDAALPTRFVPRVIAVERGQVRLDVTGNRGGGLSRAAAALAGAGQ